MPLTTQPYFPFSEATRKNNCSIKEETNRIKKYRNPRQWHNQHQNVGSFLITQLPLTAQLQIIITKSYSLETNLSFDTNIIYRNK